MGFDDKAAATSRIAREREIIGQALADIEFRLGSDPASQAIKFYLWCACDPKGRRMDPMPDFVATGQADSAELERLMVGVTNASPAWPDDQAAVVRIIHLAFAIARLNLAF
jgi:hypothetical protein